MYKKGQPALRASLRSARRTRGRLTGQSRLGTGSVGLTARNELEGHFTKQYSSERDIARIVDHFVV